jgi:hypothetical protein
MRLEPPARVLNLQSCLLSPFVSSAFHLDAGDDESTFFVDGNANGTPDECGLPSDADGGGDVDLQAHGVFLSCDKGPEAAIPPEGTGVDIDAEDDVDLVDFAALQGGLTGPSLQVTGKEFRLIPTHYGFVRRQLDGGAVMRFRGRI